MKEQIEIWIKRNLKGDPVIWTIVIVLSLLSTLVVYSAVSAPAFKHKDGNTEYFLIKHAVLIMLSIGAMWMAHNINYNYYARISRLLLILSVPLLLYTFFFGVDINQAHRWIMIPIINQTFQTSDLAKLALIANLASMLAKRQKNIEDVKSTLIPLLFWCGTICGLIALSDLSSALLLFATCLLIMFIGRVPVKYLFALVMVGLFFIIFALKIGDRWDTAMSRMDIWFSMVSGAAGFDDYPYQVQQSNIAIARGGFWGVGVGQSQQRYFLPEAFSDYIFAIINEEYGLKISLLVIFLYLGLLYRGMSIASQSEKAFGGLLAAGLSFSLVLQAFANMAVVSGLAPVTGLPLPLLSMGGTSLLFTGFAIGIVLSVSRGDNSEEEVATENTNTVNNTSSEEVIDENGKEGIDE